MGLWEFLKSSLSEIYIFQKMHQCMHHLPPGKITFNILKINSWRLGELHLIILYLIWTHLPFSSLRRGNFGLFYDDFWVWYFIGKILDKFYYRGNVPGKHNNCVSLSSSSPGNHIPAVSQIRFFSPSGAPIRDIWVVAYHHNCRPHSAHPNTHRGG